MSKVIDLTGQKFGRLTVVQRGENSKAGKARWICVCECGNPTSVLVVGSDLMNGRTKSCGCSQAQTRIENGKKNTTHGQSNTRLYKIWIGMKKRCYNPSSIDYKNYGAKGIKICDEWHDFSVFNEWAIEHGYSKDLTIDRKDCAKDYSPENCQWSDILTQNNNKTNSHHLTYKGETKTMSEWCRELNLSYNLVKQRINVYGWTVEDAFEKPKK